MVLKVISSGMIDILAHKSMTTLCFTSLLVSTMNKNIVKAIIKSFQKCMYMFFKTPQL